MQKLISLVKNTRRALALSYGFAPGVTLGIFGVSIAIGLAPLFQAKILGDIVDRLIESFETHAPLEAMVFLIAGYAAVWGGMRMASALQTYLQKIWYIENEQGLELTVLKKRTEIDLALYENPEFQNLLLRAFNRSIWPVFELADAQFQIFANIAVIIASSIVTSAISPVVYLIILVSSIPGFVVQFKYGYRVWTIWGEHSERQRKYAHMRHHITNRTGVTQLKLYQNHSRVFHIIREIMFAFKKDQLKADTRRFLYEMEASLISALGFGLALFLIARTVLIEGQPIGILVFVISALGALVVSLNQLLRQVAVQLEKDFYATDIFKVLDTKPYVKRPENPIKLHLSTPPLIEFKNVSFKYEGREDWILKDVNLILKPGEKVALVGMNGAGKSTLIKLLSRIYDPTEGDIIVNGINLRDVDMDEWNSYLSVLLQDYLTYDLTVKESIGMGRSSIDADMAKIQEASEHSGAHEFIRDWGKQYEQQLGKEFEGGIEPSKGQQQKIALARTIYRNGLVMVLDEPTAAIDALSEMRIFEAMEKAVGNHTLIVITHRFNTTQSLDKIIVLDKGTVVEIGTHKELLQHGGLYAEMFESQAKAFRTDSVSDDHEISKV